MIRITIKLGDICDEIVDAIVNPANVYGTMGGGVGKSLRMRGGSVLESEATAHTPIPIGTALVTTAGKLQAHHIIHAPTVEEPGQASSVSNIRDAVHAALTVADENELRTISMPGMGCGAGGVSKPEAARIIVETISGYKSQYLKDVKLVCRDKELYDSFVEVLEDASRTAKLKE